MAVQANDNTGINLQLTPEHEELRRTVRVFTGGAVTIHLHRHGTLLKTGHSVPPPVASLSGSAAAVGAPLAAWTK